MQHGRKGDEMTDKQPESHTTLYDVCQEVLRLESVNAELLEALKTVLTKNLNLFNNFPDTTLVPTDLTLGELRKISAAIFKAEMTK